MTCAEMEIAICDYVDGTLAPGPKAEVERHLAECPACAEMARDSAAAVEFIGRAAEVSPPPELVTRILFTAPWRTNKPPAHGLRSRLSGWLSPLLQPKFVMGAAMTILSFSIFSQFAPVRQLRASDLQPAVVWHGLEDRVLDVWDRAVKFYDNLKFVYQIQTTLHEWQQEDQEQQPVKSRKSSRSADEHKLPSKSAPAGAPSNAGGGNH